MRQNILSVWQVNAYIKKVLDTDYVLKNIWIKGEISNCKIHRSGHVYFTLKDHQGAIQCVLFKGNRQFVKCQLKDGMKILANGSISVYERSGQYQLYVREIIEDGVGILYKKFEELKITLEEKGLFSSNLKKKIPMYPRKVGVVTSDTGAAIRDIAQVAKRRNPNIQLVLYPSLVQGDDAKYNIIEGIRYLDQLEDVDVIIIGRGGGSIEDLWAFNEEIVANTIFVASTPIISAVGHETDFTIADFVADLRAPTPSAGAELAVPLLSDIEDTLDLLEYKLKSNLEQKIDQKRSQYELYKAKLALYNPHNRLAQYIQYLNELQDRLDQRILYKVDQSKNKLGLIQEHLRRVSPVEKLKDGYAYIMNLEQQHIRSVESVRENEEIEVQLIDGKVNAKVTKITHQNDLWINT